MAFFIIIIVGDFGYILDFLLFLATTTYDYGWSGISSSFSKATILRLALFILLSLVSLFFLFFLGFFLGLLGLGPLFGLIGLSLALTLRRRTGFLGLYKLIVSEIEVYFQRLFSYEALLI